MTLAKHRLPNIWYHFIGNKVIEWEKLMWLLQRHTYTPVMQQLLNQKAKSFNITRQSPVPHIADNDSIILSLNTAKFSAHRGVKALLEPTSSTWSTVSTRVTSYCRGDPNNQATTSFSWTQTGSGRISDSLTITSCTCKNQISSSLLPWN